MGKWLGYTKVAISIVSDDDGSENATRAADILLTSKRVYRPVDYIFIIVIRVMVRQLPNLTVKVKILAGK